MIRQRLETRKQHIPDIYYHIARNMRGRDYSFDHIRQVVIRRGLSWEKSLLLVADIEAEEAARRPKVHFPVRQTAVGRYFSCGIVIIGAGVWLLSVLSQAAPRGAWLLLILLMMFTAVYLMRGFLMWVGRYF